MHLARSGQFCCRQPPDHIVAHLTKSSRKKKKKRRRRESYVRRVYAKIHYIYLAKSCQSCNQQSVHDYLSRFSLKIFTGEKGEIRTCFERWRNWREKDALGELEELDRKGPVGGTGGIGEKRTRWGNWRNWIEKDPLGEMEELDRKGPVVGKWRNWTEKDPLGELEELDREGSVGGTGGTG